VDHEVEFKCKVYENGRMVADAETLRSKKVREIAQAMQVSTPYAAFVRSGKRRPHPRHWEALALLAGGKADEG